MSTHEQKTVIETIMEMYDKIFRAEKKVADYILKNPDIAVQANVSELAELSGVSDATVIRLCKHLGYAGYYQMKLCLSKDMGRREEFLNKKPEERSSMSGIFKEIAENVIRSGAAIEEKVFAECLELIKKSTMVHLVAAGNTTPICMYNGPRMERLGIRCTYSMLPEHYLNHINVAPKTDIVLAVSGSGTSKNVISALELAKERGLKTIAVTGYRQSPVSKLADHLLLSASGNLSGHHYALTSRLSEMAVLEALILGLEQATSESGELMKTEFILSETKL